jgi:hypothetical protein
VDPLIDIFGESTPELYSRQRLYAVHGPVDRLPAFMRSGVLVDLPALCKRYQGAIEVAQGKSYDAPERLEFIGSGGQVRVQGARPEALLALGLTVYFAELEPAVPESGAFLRAIERTLGCPAGCSNMGLFVNAPGSGLPMHHDSHDHLFIQLKGTKRFVYVPERLTTHPTIQFAPGSRVHPQFGSVYGAGFPSDLFSLEESEGETLVLEPGSAFFMPAGTLHRTTEQTDFCMSLIVSIKPPSKLDLVLNALRFKMSEFSELRAPSYGYFSGADDPNLGKICSDVAEALQGFKERDLTRAWLTSLHREGVLAEHPGQPFDAYIRVPSTRWHTKDASDERVRLHVRPVNVPDGFELEIASEALRIVTYLADTCAGFSSEEICSHFDEFEEEDVTSLLDQLCRVGFLRPLPFRRSR